MRTWLFLVIYVVLAVAAVIPIRTGLRGGVCDPEEGYTAAARILRDPELVRRANRLFVRTGSVVFAMCLPPIVILSWATRRYEGDYLPYWMLFGLLAWFLIQMSVAYYPFEWLRRAAA